MSAAIRETALEDVSVDLPVDGGTGTDRDTDTNTGTDGAAPRRPVAVEVPAAPARDAAWWTALFVAFLHRYTAADRVHLIAPLADGGEGVDLRSFPVAGDDTVGALAKAVQEILDRDPAPTRLVAGGRAAEPWTTRVVAGLPRAGSGAAQTDPQPDISIDLSEGRVRLVADARHWNGPTRQRMADHLALMAAAADADHEARVAELPMVSAEERARMLLEWNATDVAWPEGGYLDLLRARVAERPGEPALVHDDRTVTFAELESESNRIAHLLVEQGTTPGARVGLLCPTSADFVLAAIGVLKTGAAVVAMDPVNPDGRIGFMIEDSAPVAVLTTAALTARVPQGRPVFVIGGPECAAQPDTPVEAEITGDTVSHLIYTSGSTGEPKAVLERHRALVNLVHWTQRAYGVREGDRASWLSTPGFAVQLMECMPYLALGVPVHIGQAAGRSPEELRDWLVGHGVTHTMLVAALAEKVWALDWPAAARLRILVTTAERVHSWPPADTPFRVVMTYGSTETTNVLSCLDLGIGQDHTSAATDAALRAVRPVPVGRPIANLRVYLLDPVGQPVPVGVVGRLHIAGHGLAAGYHRRPELTAAKFAPNRLAEEPDAVLYDSGDLARYRADGVLELLGRSDSQVKVRGFRVEIGEVESVLHGAPGVHEGVVVAYEPQPGDVRLVAYVCAEPGEDAPVGVRAFVQEHLPHYMVPAVVIPLDELPRLANGKVDRQRLPAPERNFRDGLDTEFVEPAGPEQQEIARMWSEVLCLDRVGAQDNFFALGGHSLLAVRMCGRVATAFGIELRLPELIDHPTVEALAAYVVATAAGTL